MAIFNYKGMTKDGKEVKSSITIDSIASAKQKLKSQGIILLSISEKKAKSQSPGKFGITIGSGVNVNDLALMTRQLATLVKAKIQIVEALQALVDQVENPTLQVILSDLKQKVNEGSSLAKALSDYPKVFNNVYVNMVEAGEASGTLDVVLVRLADFTEAQVKLKNRIKGAMTYPVIMAIFGSIMMVIIFIFVIPKIAKIFESSRKELPLQTKICIEISHFLQNYWWLVIIMSFVLAWAIKKYINSSKGQANWHKVQLKLPIVGVLVKMINVSRFCSTLATLLNSGVPIITALNIVKNLIPNIWMKKAVEDCQESVQEGGIMAAPLAKSGHFPPMVTHMIGLGEKSGELEPMLVIIAENYEDQVDSKLNGLTSVLEPIMMVGMGIAVAFIVFSVVVPMMSLNTVN